MERLGAPQVGAEFVSADVRQQRRAVFVAFAATHEQQPLIEVDVFDAQLATLRDPQPAAVDQRGHEPRRPAQGVQQGGRFGDAQHDRQMAPAFGSRRQRQALRFDSEHFTTQEQDRAECLILSAGRDALPHRQVGEIIPNRFRIDARPREAFTFDEVVEKAPHQSA